MPNVLVSEQSTTHYISSVLPWGDSFWTRVICIAYRKPGSQSPEDPLLLYIRNTVPKIRTYSRTRIQIFRQIVNVQYVYGKWFQRFGPIVTSWYTVSKIRIHRNCIRNMVPKIRTQSNCREHSSKDSDP